MPSFTDATVTVPTLAVIPFRTIGGAEDPEVFSQGLTEDLITALSSRQALRVVVVNPARRTRRSIRNWSAANTMLNTYSRAVFAPQTGRCESRLNWST